MNDHKTNVKAIFDRALELELPGERDSFLGEECANDAELRAKVEGLLMAHEQSGSFLESPPPGIGATTDQPLIDIASHPMIGPYKLLEELGVGGMGTVYMAEQTEPIRRKVALKIIKPGMDTRQVIARFEAERQALAIMDHPNIAKVLDAGTTESGRPYFAMELVRGVPITEYCDAANLSTPERLRLLADVCRAVQHAHQKGIIHRDLKPTNVLVTMHDDHPVPKVIDFGVAKAIKQELTAQTLFTTFAQMIGTPLYMSPEQAQMNEIDVDTRSDVYSLGVMLYELLTGATPFDSEALKKVDYDEMRRIIREEEPPKPSDRLSTLSAQDLSTISAKRGHDPRQLSHSLQGELDWIVLRALEKDRTRRYESASSFAADIEHYLNDEPVVACPPSATYRFKKFVRRNKAVFTTTTLVAVALLMGTGVSVWQAVRATRAEQTALAEAETAEQKAAEADAVVDFLVNDLLGSASPEQTLGRLTTVEEVLAEAEKKIDTAFTDQPVVEAAICHTLGLTYFKLGKYEPAERHLTRAVALRTRHLGAEHVDTLSSMDTLARVVLAQGNFTESRKLHEETLEVRSRLLGTEHQDTLLSSMNYLADEIWYLGNHAEAGTIVEKTLDAQRRVLGPEHEDTLVTMENLAYVLADQGKLAESQKLYEETLEIRRRVLGPEHPDTLSSMLGLASAFGDQGKHAEAQKLHEETLEMMRRVLGPEHPDTLLSMTYLAYAFLKQEKFAEAQKLYEESFEISRRVLGLEHPHTTRSMTGIVVVRRDQARSLMVDAVPSSSDILWALEVANRTAELRPHWFSPWLILGWAHYRTGDWQASIDSLEKSIELQDNVGDSWQWFFLAMARWQLGEEDEARRWYDMSVEWMEINEPNNEELRRFRAEAAELMGIERGDEGEGEENDE